ncbi:phosphatidate cytidylyltransferase [Mariniplasma anaerobium]|uniref:Phosphatidate cytidylyltransferase n=1 Tax=Mariniplasma anaerobium TaxID=2735436 RepID=A0A7U9TMB4_9MOLU|nr:phosphatidate cytidylyltransferase [Mariniplasma anaerobium]BCR36523.1 phosphatidate cytidylyltransferase [Mariniplasma anaerobium]
MKKRMITGAVLALVLIPTVSFEIFLGIFQVLMILFVVIATTEMIRMYETEKKFQLLPKIGIVLLTLGTFFSVGGVMGDLEHNPLEANGLLSITIPLITLILFSFLVLFKNFNGLDVGKALTIINYVGLGAASIVILRFLGVRFIVYLLLITSATDIFAYLFGVKYGKHKLAPHISPKKSWEGAIAGTIFATIIASSFALFYGQFFQVGTVLGDFLNSGGQMTLLDNFSSLGERTPVWVQGLIIVPITMVASIFAQIGDLVASRLKRTYNIKDFGNILPGHGGLLDRFDSVLFVALFLTSIFLLIYRLFPAVIL